MCFPFWKSSNFGANPGFPGSGIPTFQLGCVFTGETKSIEGFEESRGSDDCQRTVRPGGDWS